MKSLEEVNKRLESMKKGFEKEKTTVEILEKEKQYHQEEVMKLEKEQMEKLLMKEVLKKASDKARENGKDVFVNTSTPALQMVMGPNVSVDIKLGEKAGSPVAELRLLKDFDGEESSINPLSDGGGLADIVSFSTFMSLGMLIGSENMAPIFLDEPTKFVSKGNSPNVAEAIKEIVSYTQKQTILVTHDDEIPLVADNAYFVEQDPKTGVSTVKKLT